MPGSSASATRSTSRRGRDRRVRRAGDAAARERRLLGGAVLADRDRRGRRRDRAALRQRRERGGRHVLELGRDRGAALGRGGRGRAGRGRRRGCARARPARPGWAGRGRARRCDSPSLRGVDEHPAELAAADDAERRAGRDVRHGRRAARPAGASRSTAPSLQLGRSSPAPRRSGARDTRRAWLRSAASPAASMATANSAALAAPALPIAKVATGMPLRHLDDRVERVEALQVRLSTGTPSTGTVVLAASMPGRWAAPPAPAMIARRPRPAAASA